MTPHLEFPLDLESPPERPELSQVRIDLLGERRAVDKYCAPDACTMYPISFAWSRAFIGP